MWERIVARKTWTNCFSQQQNDNSLYAVTNVLIRVTFFSDWLLSARIGNKLQTFCQLNADWITSFFRYTARTKINDTTRATRANAIIVRDTSRSAIPVHSVAFALVVDSFLRVFRSSSLPNDKRKHCATPSGWVLHRVLPQILWFLGTREMSRRYKSANT